MEKKKNQSREGEQDWSKVRGVAVENGKMVNHWWKELNESNQEVRLIYYTIENLQSFQIQYSKICLTADILKSNALGILIPAKME